jgi:hypothetical protein
LEAVEKLSPEQFCQGADRHKEVVLCRNPTGAVWVESTCGDDDMKVDVGVELLIPCVKDRGEPRQHLQPGPTLSQLEQGLGGGLKEQVEQDALVSYDERVELVRQGQDHVEVTGGQKALASLGDPTEFLKGLTLGTMPISAGVEGQAPVAASAFTGFHVASEGGRSAVEDVAYDFSLLVADRMGLHVGSGMDTQDIAELYGGFFGRGGPYFFRLHGLPPLVLSFDRASKGLSMVCR